jgi:flagellar motility protein MotE (MotC chaperone)
MKNGYDQFFKNARKAAAHPPPKGLPQSRPQQRKVQTQDAKMLAQELRQRLKPHGNPKKTKRREIPWKLVGISILGLMVAAIGLTQAEEIEKYAHKIEISFLGTAHAETAPAAAPAEKPAEDKAKEGEKKAAEPGAKKEYSEDEINHFSKLNERKRELDAREEELSRMEQEIQTQKTELDKRLAELENTRKNISTVLEEKVQADDKKVDNLVAMYSTMKPQQAAKAFEEMDEGLAIEILGRMKKKNAAEIMNLVKSEKVKIFSERYAGYKRN